MKLIKTASGRALKVSKKEWHEMGKDAGWLKHSDEEEIVQDVPTAPTPNPTTPEAQPMGWDPAAIREQADEVDQQDEGELWGRVDVSFETKQTKYGPLTFVVLSNTERPISPILKELGYKAFKNRITGQWTWSKIVNKRKSTEIDTEKLSAVKTELDEKGVNTAVLSSGPVSIETPDASGASDAAAEDLSLQEDDIPDEMIGWHNEMEAASKLSTNEKKKKYSEIIFGALEDVGDQTELDSTSEQSQAIVKSLLQAASKFHNYSFWNSMMIAITSPNSEYVASADNWMRMGRIPKKDAKKIPIMFPYQSKVLTEEDKKGMTPEDIRRKSRRNFGLGSAVSFKDTEPISEDWVSKRGKFKGQGPFEPPVWQIDSQEATPWLNQLYTATYKWATETKNFRIDIEGMELTGGYATIGGKIAINSKSDGIVKMSTLFHEIAHQLIHFDPDFKRADSSKQDRETDAEATAYVVCSHYHIESKDTALYLAGFGANKKKILSRFDFIRKAAIEMFEGIDQVMSGVQVMQGKSPQEKEMEPDEMATIDSTPEESLATAGNMYGALGLFKVANIGSMPFLYRSEGSSQDEDSKDIL